MWFGVATLSAGIASAADEKPQTQQVTVYHNVNGYTFASGVGDAAELRQFQVLVIENGKVRATGGEDLLTEI